MTDMLCKLYLLLHLRHSVPSSLKFQNCSTKIIWICDSLVIYLIMIELNVKEKVIAFKEVLSVKKMHWIRQCVHKHCYSLNG